MAKVGDTVRFLNSVGGGVIARIEKDLAYVTDEDGFETPVTLRECVVVASGPQNRGFYESSVLGKPKEADAKQPKAASKEVKAPEPEPHELPFVETESGERLNIELAFIAKNLRALSRSSYEAYLVNDSNYYLQLAYMTKGDSQKGWTTRYAGMLEPGTQLFLCDVEPDDLTDMDRVAVAYVAYKKGREFDLKPAACVEHKLDTTKFVKLHCFKPDPYFDEPAITVPITTDDIPHRDFIVDTEALNQSMRAKDKGAKKEQRQPQHRHKSDEPIVIDLHINELLDSTAGLSNSDMLNLQIDKFREAMDSSLRHPGRKLIFIHGKGEGVLRQAIMKELARRYPACLAQDASFREYGFGATQVTIRQNKN